MKWGILSTGTIAKNFAQTAKQMPDVQVQAVASRSAGSAKAFAEAFAIPTAHDSYEALANDPHVFLMGEDVGRYGGTYAVSKGLLAEFGPERVRDTPLSELTFVGAGVGAALGGMRPIVEVMTVNFSLLALETPMDPVKLKEFYPEFVPYEADCRFQPCYHYSEPGCAVLAATQRGEIAAARTERYHQLLVRVKESWRNRYD